MLYPRLLIAVLATGLFTLGACAPTKEITTSSEMGPTGITDVNVLAYKSGPMELLELGRTVSKGSVDIYDPLATSFMVLPPARAVNPKPQAIPYSRAIVVRDKSVKVYSLVERMLQLPVDEKEPMAIADPVPLKVD